MAPLRSPKRSRARARTPLRRLPFLAVAACASGDRATDRAPATEPPVAGAVLVNELIQPGETHFKNLWRLTFDRSERGGLLELRGRPPLLQITDDPEWACDRIFATGADGRVRQVSNGQGVTTCAFFMPGDSEVLYASTQSSHGACPKFKRGRTYTWPIWPEYDIYVSSLEDGNERVLVDGYGYDAEATVSPRGDRIVFTSTRSGDLELWTCDLEGGDLRQVTDTLGYDGRRVLQPRRRETRLPRHGVDAGIECRGTGVLHRGVPALAREAE